MGNTNQSEPTSFLNSYSQVAKCPQGVILQEVSSQSTLLLKEYTYCNEIQFNMKVAVLKEEANRGVRDNILSVLRV
jgi:hypothetical protein